MGLLDGVLGAVLQNGAGGSNQGGGQSGLMASVIGGLIQQAGGVGGLLGMLKQGGLGQHADSWQGTGENLPVEGGDLMKVLGGMMGGAGGNLGDLLAKSGIGQDQLGGLLAQVLPGVVDGMTPGGQVPQAHSSDMMSSVLGSVFRSAMGGGGGKGGGLFG